VFVLEKGENGGSALHFPFRADKVRGFANKAVGHRQPEKTGLAGQLREPLLQE
jgi:hypothetical protein